jgi:hypothetical protein
MSGFPGRVRLYAGGLMRIRVPFCDHRRRVDGRALLLAAPSKGRIMDHRFHRYPLPCVRLVVMATLAVAFTSSALAARSNGAACGLRSDNPQAYDFCMQLTGQEGSNPVAGAMGPPVGIIGNTPPIKPTDKALFQRCVTFMKTRQHLTAADASAYCSRNLSP